MKLHKWVAYLLLITLLSSPFIIYRLYWLSTSVKTLATVAYIRKVNYIRSSGQMQPIFSYRTPNYIWKVGGNYNLHYNEGDKVAIRYNPRNESNFKIDTV
jgi:hypothetical protein